MYTKINIYFMCNFTHKCVILHIFIILFYNLNIYGPICSKNINNRKSDNERHINKKNGCNIDLIKKMEEMNNYITKLKEEIVKLKEENEKLNKQVIIQNNTTQNTYNITNIIQINNFNDTKDYNGNFNNLLKEIGKSIYLKTIKNVYLNPEKP